ncbi:magnesium transporter CorA family protein [Paenibacillus psychroresistens]|uniref:magnesium transporter CorA family protein n=1 Tax=Paenibacillus psychroresistens TaxID=1778678 RepID=UPI001390E568|nr:magnesium transporter CorA family protein [Paenibacillus psychroresistens]
MASIHLNNSNGWNWQQFDPQDKHDIKVDCADNWQFKDWLEKCDKRTTDYTGVRNQGEDHALFGSLLYYHDPNQEKTKSFLHYYVTEGYLVTSHFDFSIYQRTNEQDLMDKLNACTTAQDALFILIGEILNSFLEGIDEFEESLRKLQEERKKGRNGGEMLDNIINLRYLLLHWTALTLPIQDTLLAAKEAFMDKLESNVDYQRALLRLERILTLQKYYEDEMDTLLSIEDNLTNYRGNEIVRALTVFTVVFIPVSAFGAIWGMNFKHMPELDWEWGYGLSLVWIILFMSMVYLFLRKKGWTDDLLKRKK